MRRYYSFLRIPYSATRWIVLGITIGFLPLFIYGAWWLVDQRNISDCLQQYHFTSASIDCASYAESSQRLQALDQKLGDARRLYVDGGKAARVSVWVRDLESKQWAATRENETYAPASLMKVPLMIAYYKLAEVDPRILGQEIVDNQTIDLNASERFSTSSVLVPGKSYTVEDLIKHMIVESDNNATTLLFASINRDFFARTLLDLGIQIPSGDQAVDFVTVKSYANIFRNLYNASYLNRDYAEKALELLSSPVSFRGIALGVPKGVVIADKYGERATTTENGTLLELHDCGIVYTNHPYSMCVMTEGGNYDDLLWVIQSFSAITYRALAE
jgi:beta-lactamase class A